MTDGHLFIILTPARLWKRSDERRLDWYLKWFPDYKILVTDTSIYGDTGPFCYVSGYLHGEAKPDKKRLEPPAAM